MKATLDSTVAREAGILFLAAACLGFAYNSTSPLGIRMSDSGATAPASTQTVSVPQVDPGSSDPSLHNETISAEVVTNNTEAGLPADTHKLITALAWPEVKPLAASGDVVLVDGRDTLSFEAGHIPGAISLPLKMINEKIADFTAKYPKTKPVVVYCASITCPISHAEAQLLSDQFGYTDVREMPGGYAEWMVAESQGAPPTGGKP